MTERRADDVVVVDLEDRLGSFDEHWSPRIIAELNGQHVKLAKLEGDFVWHHHESEDELFMVLAGRLVIELRDRAVSLGPGQLCVIPRGVEHRPRAESETHLLLFEPAGTLRSLFENYGGPRYGRHSPGSKTRQRRRIPRYV